jgi:hypothetical protein
MPEIEFSLGGRRFWKGLEKGVDGPRAPVPLIPPPSKERGLDVLPSLFPPSTLHHRPGFRPSLSLSQDGTAGTALSSFDLAPTTAFPLGWGG